MSCREPRKRTYERIDGAFVLMDGWQIKYDPLPEHRAQVLDVARRNRMARVRKREAGKKHS